ncbi:uncharacterized protein LOC124353371 [Homalodisca vitripennis]|uniref:uncharacterized protein LOC124353371 n=1 Tax=Homalodisca vitripennis TaxID=197043 RepID=UPI001EEC37E3|nr:uncharacterized protein LOC124353371 [Homalodisca vitripennis]
MFLPVLLQAVLLLLAIVCTQSIHITTRNEVDLRNLLKNNTNTEGATDFEGNQQTIFSAESSPVTIRHFRQGQSNPMRIGITLSVFDTIKYKNFCSFCFDISQFFPNSPCIYAATDLDNGIHYSITEETPQPDKVFSFLIGQPSSSDQCHSLKMQTDRVQACLKWKDVNWDRVNVNACMYARLKYHNRHEKDIKIHCCQFTTDTTGPPITIPHA